MTFFYNLNARLNAIASQPVQQQLTEGAKPDFPDIDQDGNRKEPISKAAKEIEEGNVTDYSAKRARAGQDIGKPGKNFSKIAQQAGEKYGSKQRGEKVAGAVLAKLRKGVKEEYGPLEELDMDENAFNQAAAAAARAGKKHFAFGGKQHPVTMNTKTAHEIDESDIDEAKTSDEHEYYFGKVDARKHSGSKELTRHTASRTAQGTKYTMRDLPGHDSDTDHSDKPQRGAGRPKGKGKAIGAKGPSGKSKLLTRENDTADSDLKSAMSMLKKAGYRITKTSDSVDEEAVSRDQAVAARIARGVQKGEVKAKPGSASAEMAKMKPGELKKFAKTNTKGLPKKVSKKKEVEETTVSGSIATAPAVKEYQGASALQRREKWNAQADQLQRSGFVKAADQTKKMGKEFYPDQKPSKSKTAVARVQTESDSDTGSKGNTKGFQYGKGIYDSLNRDLEQMISEALTVNVSMNSDGHSGAPSKSITVTATDQEADSLAMLLARSGLISAGDSEYGSESVTENQPDWPTNTETSHDALQYSGGLNKPKTTVAGDGQTTVPVTAVQVGQGQGLAEDDADDAHKKSQVAAFMRKKSGDPNWKTTTQDLEKAKERNISGKEGLAALNRRVDQMPLGEKQTEGEATLAKIAASGDDGYEMIYDGLNGLLGSEAQIILQDMYDDISIEHRLHPDDDLEDIISRMVDRIETDYGSEDDNDDYTDYSMRQGELGNPNRGIRENIAIVNESLDRLLHLANIDNPKKKVHESIDDMFSLSGKLPPTDSLDVDSTSKQNYQTNIVDKIKQNTINHILNLRPELKRSDLEQASAAELIRTLRELQSIPEQDHALTSTSENVARPWAVTLADHIALAERAYSQPVAGDYFAINIKEETLFETWVCDETTDGIVLYADHAGMKLLEDHGYLDFSNSSDSESEYRADSDGDTVDVIDQGEYGYEGDQARDQLQTIVRAAQRLNGMVDDDDDLPEWVQMKITKAEDYLDTAADYIASNREQQPAKDIDEAKYQGREVPLGKPMAGDVKKSKVYVRGPKGNVVKVNFGQKGMKIKKNIPGRRKNFRARHNCDNPGPRHKARYWSCRAW